MRNRIPGTEYLFSKQWVGQEGYVHNYYSRNLLKGIGC